MSPNPNLTLTLTLTRCAQEIADSFDGATLTVLDKAECEARGMGAYLAVSQGSCEPPKFIHLTLAPKGGGKAAKKI